MYVIYLTLQQIIALTSLFLEDHYLLEESIVKGNKGTLSNVILTTFVRLGNTVLVRAYGDT